MDFTLLNPSTLRELIKLTEQKASLQKQIAAIDARLSAIGGGKATTAKAPAAKPAGKRGRPAKAAAKPAKAPKAPKAPKKAAAPKVAGKRGALKNDILKLLSAAGPEGASVKDISAKLGVKNQNVHVWFATTGKKLAEISKVGEARYAYQAPTTLHQQPEA